jgi:hypothetical protein
VEYRPSLYTTIWTDDAYPRRVRALGRHEFDADYGRNSTTAWFGRITALRAGNYFACTRGVAQLYNGLVSSHSDCRRFRLR